MLDTSKYKMCPSPRASQLRSSPLSYPCGYLSLPVSHICQVSGGRWLGLKRPRPAPDAATASGSARRSQPRERPSLATSRSSAAREDVWGEGDVGVYELAYDVRVAPSPWNRTRVITVESRWEIHVVSHVSRVFSGIYRPAVVCTAHDEIHC